MNHYFKIVVAMLIWSTWGLMIRWLDLPPVVVLFYGSLVASFTVPLVLKIRGEFPAAALSCEAWPVFAGLIASSIVNNLTYFYSLGHTTISNAVFTHYTAPVFVALLSPMLIHERLSKATLISLPIAVLGMGLIVTAGGGLMLNGGHGPGIIAGTVSGLAYALLILVSRKLSRGLMHNRAMVILLWATAIVTAPIALTLEHSLDIRRVFLLMAAGVFHSTIAPLLYFNGLRRALAQHAAILGYIEPLAAIPLATFFLSEQPPLIALLGGLLILFSGYLVIRERPE